MAAKAEQITSTGAVLSAYVARRISLIASGSARNLAEGLEPSGLLTASKSSDGDLNVDGVELGEPASSVSFTAQCEALDRQAKNLRGAGLRVVGYFRTCATLFSLSDLDLQLVRECIPECRYILLVRPPAGGGATFRVFRADAEGSWRPSSEFEVATADANAMGAPEPEQSARFDPPVRNRLRRNLLLSGGAVTAAITGVLIFSYLHSRTPLSPDHKLPPVQQSRSSVGAEPSANQEPASPSANRAPGNSVGTSAAVKPQIHAVPGVAVETMTVTPAESSGSRYVGPQPLEEFMPPTKLLGKWLVPTSCEIMVQVRIAGSGMVTEARLIREVPPDERELADQVLASARRWIFRPATIESVTVESKQVLIFHCKRTAR